METGKTAGLPRSDAPSTGLSRPTVGRRSTYLPVERLSACFQGCVWKGCGCNCLFRYALIPSGYKSWTTETKLPSVKGQVWRTFTGGCAIAYGDSSILLMGGVNYGRFLTALNRSIYMERAEERLEFEGLERLIKREKSTCIIRWNGTNSNTFLLQYNTFTKEWIRAGDYEQLARAGAGPY